MKGVAHWWGAKNWCSL